MPVRDLAWTDFSGWVDLYYSRYTEVEKNPDLGVHLLPNRPSLAEEEGRLVGVCTVGRRGRHLEDRHIGVLGIGVDPDRRGRGIGDALLGHAVAKCRGLFEVVELKVVAVNARAIRLYRRHGFEVYGQQPRSFRRGERYLDELLMWRPVDDPATAGTP